MPRERGVWVDMGAGDGTFTRALVELLGPAGRIYAVDRNARAIASVRRWAAREAPNVIALDGDFAESFELRDVTMGTLDGMLFANSLHYLSKPAPILARLSTWLRRGGRVVFVEYDRRGANRWVPYPIPRAALPVLAAASGLSTPVFTASRPSSFSGELYVAFAVRTPGEIPGSARTVG